MEKRFAKSLGINSRMMDSVALTVDEHRIFTNAWRKAVPYGTDYMSMSRNTIWGHAQIIYKDYPALLDTARRTIF